MCYGNMRFPTVSQVRCGGGGRWIFKYNSFQGPEFLSENVSKEKCLRMHCKQNLLKSLLKPTYAFCQISIN